MGVATLLALCLCGQIRYSSDDSINQWENHLLEARWALMDQAAAAPRILLVLKCYTPEHRVFELYLYDGWDNARWTTVRAWTGSYKMEARENRDKSISEKIVRLNFQQHWVPVDTSKLLWMRSWAANLGFVHWTREPYLVHWTEELDFLHWTEERDFNPFLAEFKVDGPMPGEPFPPECVKFLLRSNDVKKVGWWVTGVEYVLEPVPKWRRAPWLSGYGPPPGPLGPPGSPAPLEPIPMGPEPLSLP